MSKFWFDNVKNLASSFSIIPSRDDDLDQQLNALTRLAILICILIAFFHPLLATSTCVICLIIIAAIHFASAQKYSVSSSKMEKFTSIPDIMKEARTTPRDSFVCGTAGSMFKTNPDSSLAMIGFPLTKRFCNDDRPLRFDQEYKSQNQALVGLPNPKTKIPPIVAPPSHDLDFWKASDFVVNSKINSETNFDAHRAGYIGSQFSFNNGTANTYSGYVQKKEPISKTSLFNPPSRSDLILTQTIQPGIYEKSDFSEPINSLIGISQQKQFDDTIITSTPSEIMYAAQTPRSDPYGLFVKENFQEVALQNNARKNRFGDSRIVNFSNLSSPEMTYPSANDVSIFQTESNVYDPRFTGYGPSDRGYIEPTTGQPRFAYDDIDAVRMPNFIARNNVDIFPWATQYGSGMNGNTSLEGIKYGDGYKQLANDAFEESTLQFRTELQERLMRKRNAEMWQRRVAPISTMSNSGMF